MCWGTSEASAPGSPVRHGSPSSSVSTATFPPAFGRIHPRWQTPYVAILTQAVLATVFLLVVVLGKGTTVERAYLIVLDTMLLVYFIPYIYLFICYLVVRLRERARAECRHARPLAALTGVSGLALTLFAMIVATVPPSDTPDPWVFRLEGDRRRRPLRAARRADLLAGPAVSRSRARALFCARAPSPCAAPGGAAGPVLRQVKVPHPYYFREMFIPQVDQRPGLRNLVARWPGADLRHAGLALAAALGSEEARQLTRRPGLRLPAGLESRRAARSVRVLPRRRRRAAAAGPRHRSVGALVANGAVNLEPRWSPDGGRLRITSSAHEGRWHVFVCADSDSSHGGPDAALPRTMTAASRAITTGGSTST